MSVYKFYWKKGDLFVGRGGGTVLWRVLDVRDDQVTGQCLLDRDVRTFRADTILRRSDMQFTYLPMGLKPGVKING